MIHNDLGQIKDIPNPCLRGSVPSILRLTLPSNSTKLDAEGNTMCETTSLQAQLQETWIEPSNSDGIALPSIMQLSWWNLEDPAWCPSLVVLLTSGRSLTWPLWEVIGMQNAPVRHRSQLVKTFWVAGDYREGAYYLKVRCFSLRCRNIHGLQLLVYCFVIGLSIPFLSPFPFLSSIPLSSSILLLLVTSISHLHLICNQWPIARRLIAILIDRVAELLPSYADSPHLKTICVLHPQSACAADSTHSFGGFTPKEPFMSPPTADALIWLSWVSSPHSHGTALPARQVASVV